MKLSGFGSNAAAEESVKVGFELPLCANARQIQASVKAADHDYHLHVVETVFKALGVH